MLMMSAFEKCTFKNKTEIAYSTHLNLKVIIYSSRAKNLWVTYNQMGKSSPTRQRQSSVPHLPGQYTARGLLTQTRGLGVDGLLSSIKEKSLILLKPLT